MESMPPPPPPGSKHPASGSSSASSDSDNPAMDNRFLGANQTSGQKGNNTPIGKRSTRHHQSQDRTLLDQQRQDLMRDVAKSYRKYTRAQLMHNAIDVLQDKPAARQHWQNEFTVTVTMPDGRTISLFPRQKDLSDEQYAKLCKQSQATLEKYKGDHKGDFDAAALMNEITQQQATYKRIKTAYSQMRMRCPDWKTEYDRIAHKSVGFTVMEKDGELDLVILLQTTPTKPATNTSKPTKKNQPVPRPAQPEPATQSGGVAELAGDDMGINEVGNWNAPLLRNPAVKILKPRAGQQHNDIYIKPAQGPGSDIFTGMASVNAGDQDLYVGGGAINLQFEAELTGKRNEDNAFVDMHRHLRSKESDNTNCTEAQWDLNTFGSNKPKVCYSLHRKDPRGGDVFIHIFTDDTCPHADTRNRAMIYVVPPKGTDFKGKDAERNFLQAVESTAYSAVSALQEYNRRAKDNGKLPPVPVMRMCCFSSASYLGGVSTPQNVASFIERGCTLAVTDIVARKEPLWVREIQYEDGAGGDFSGAGVNASPAVLIRNK